jgi:hypothetical protein
METVRDILAAHHSGISKPGLLAWARLRIDTAMTEMQLDEELARLGDEVVDVDGFLYLRDYVDPSRRRAAGPGPAPAAAIAPTWSPPVQGRSPLRNVAKLIGVGFFLWWLVSFIGGFVGAFVDEGGATPEPTRPAAPTPTVGTVIGWEEIAVGDCLVPPTEDVFYEIRRVPCDTPHGGEVFFIVAYPGTAFPDDDAFASFARASCGPEFTAWTGTPLAEQELLDISWFRPTEKSWASGDRTVQCYLGPADGSTASRSYRNANP